MVLLLLFFSLPHTPSQVTAEFIESKFVEYTSEFSHDVVLWMSRETAPWSSSVARFNEAG
jgi:hypothetical protein